MKQPKRLTTIAQPTREIGRKAMELLLEQIGAGQEDLVTREQRQVILAPELRIRNSTAPPALVHKAESISSGNAL
ncbi:MAG: substrate-binding domain-containing protein [Bryobacteraceae bacterium]